MSMRVIMQEPNRTDRVWDFSDEVMASLDAYRATFVETVIVNNVPTQVPRWATVRDMITSFFTDQLAIPALSQFKTATVQAKAEIALQANNELAAAQTAELASLLTQP